jgi:hypothetical protein
MTCSWRYPDGGGPGSGRDFARTDFSRSGSSLGFEGRDTSTGRSGSLTARPHATYMDTIRSQVKPIDIGALEETEAVRPRTCRQEHVFDTIVEPGFLESRAHLISF